MKSYIIIPARMESERLPNKPLLEMNGKPLLQWTHERALQVGADNVLVTTPDQEIINFCNKNNMECYESSYDNPTGTHRCAEIIFRLEIEQENDIQNENERTVIVNWQCDEPLIEPDDVFKLMNAVDLFFDIGTLVAPLWPGLMEDRNITKAIVGKNAIAHWFTRTPTNYAKGHIGIYAFRQPTLKKLKKLRVTELSKQESLEQLTWIENGFTIGSIGTKEMPLSINCPEDIELFNELHNASL